MSTAVPSLLSAMQDREISLLGVSEHCLPMARPEIRDTLHQAFHRHDFNHLTYRFDSSSEKVEGKLYGGSGMIATDRFASSLDTGAKFGDSMGRWTGMTFRRRHQRPLTIISIYQACHTPTNAFGDTAWHQQQRELASQGRHHTHPRRAFSDDLVALVQQLQQQNHSVLLGGDWNAVHQESRSVIRRLIDQCHLMDPWAHFNPNDLNFATHDRSKSRRIDSIVMSPDLLSSVDSVSYSPVGELFDSDHRAVCLTLKTCSAFGSDDPMFTPFLARGVRSKDTAAVEKMVDTMYSHLAEHGAFARSANLENDDRLQIELVEAIDALLGEAGQAGEKKCRRRRAPWYNTPMVKLRLKRQALRFYLRGLRKQINRANNLLSRSSIANLGMTFPDTIEETLAQLVQLSEELRDAISKDQSTRQQELNAKADRYELAHERGRARAVRQMNKTEAAGRAYATFARMANNSTQRLDRIEIPADWPAPHEEVHTLSDPKTCTQWREVSNPSEVKYYLMLRNRLHFGQAQGTPFTESPLTDEFDWEATTPQVEEVLAGTYENTSLTPDTSLVLKHCKSLCDLDSVPCSVTDEDFCGKLKKWRETTSTSPSGRHLGWYKALVVQGSFSPGSEEAQDFEAKQFAIRSVILRVMNHCLRHGYSLQRWRTIVNTMIFKDVGVYKIHRLRVIHIYEADFNLLLGVKWRQLMWNAEKNDQFHPGQFGGRPGLEASTLALMEELRIDISYLTRRTLIQFDADAASCYDRIIPLLASLINRHAGLHRHIVVVHAATLRQARYKLRTSLGVSDLEYTHCHAFPLYGTGQGAGNSPCIWLFISSTLFKAHATQAFGARFESPDGTVSTDVTLVGFVDDTNAASNTWYPQHEEPFTEIVRRMLHDAQAWTNLLHVSGGKLEIDKSSFHVLRFTFKKDGTAVPVHLPPRDVSFELKDPASGDLLPVKCMFTSQPHKTLGHWKSPIQRPSPYQLKALQHKADKISRQIAGSPVTRYGAFLGYTSKFLPAIKYPLPQSFFTASQLERAEQPSRARLISKCGYNSKTSHAIIFLPPDLAGASFVHWHTLQGEGQITNFLKHWRSPTPTNELLRIDLAWSQYFTGIGVPLLEHPGIRVPTLPNRWVSSLRSTLHQFGSTIQVDTPFLHPLERAGDQHIMDYVRTHDLFPDQRDLDLFNLCRLYVQAWTLSELISVDGTTLLPGVWHLQRPIWLDSQRNHVLQERPSDYQIRTKWRKFCLHLLDSQKLIRPCLFLYRWLPRNRLHRRRETYLEHDPEPKVYHWHEDCYWLAVPRTSLLYFYCQHPTEWQPTTKSVPLQVRKVEFPQVCLTQAAPRPSSPVPDSLPVDLPFSAYFRTQATEDSTLLAAITWDEQPFQLMHTLCTMSPETQLLLVSDGSSRENCSMSYGAILGTSKGTILARVSGPAYGQPSSNRAKGTGTYAAGLLLRHLSRYTGIPLPSISTVTVCDNKQVIGWLNTRQEYSKVYANSTLKADYDVLEATHQIFQELHLPSHKFEWERGHQDRHGDVTKLSVRASYNVLADEIADRYMSKVDSTTRLCTHLLPGTKCLLHIDGKTIHSHYLANIRRAASKKDFHLHLQRNFAWSQELIDQLYWPAFQRAARSYYSSGVHLMKLVYEQLPTKFLIHRHLKDTQLQCCSHCSRPETLEHLICDACSPATIAFHHAIIQNVDKYLSKVNAPDVFRSLVLSGIQIALNIPQNDDDLYELWGPFTELFQHQSEIGWYHFLRGFLSSQWQTCLHRLSSATSVATASDDSDGFHDSMFSSDDESLASASPGVPASFLDWEISIDMNFIEPPATPRQFDPLTILSGLIKTMWTDISALWHHRCELVHGQSGDSPLSLSVMRAKLTDLYALRDQVLPADRDHLFRDDIDEFLHDASLFQLRRHFATIQPRIIASMKQYKSVPKSQTRMTQFFTHIGNRLARTAAAARNHIRARLQSPATAEPDHRKRTRRRLPTTGSSESPTLLSYFSPPSPTPPAP